MEDLNDCCYEHSLDDLRFTGNLLTWSKGAGEGYIARKLDRALVNQEWLDRFQGAAAEFLDVGPSDHSPILVRNGLLLHVRRPPFRFFNFWVDAPEF